MIGTTVLVRYNVLDVERNQWRCFLRYVAVFTALKSPPSDKVSRARIHFSRPTASTGNAALLPE